MASQTRKDRGASIPIVGGPLAAAAYSVQEFCSSYRISRATLYNMWRDGAGPRRMRVRGRTLVSVEAAAAWRQEVEAANAVAAR